MQTKQLINTKNATSKNDRSAFIRIHICIHHSFVVVENFGAFFADQLLLCERLHQMMVYTINKFEEKRANSIQLSYSTNYVNSKTCSHILPGRIFLLGNWNFESANSLEEWIWTDMNAKKDGEFLIWLLPWGWCFAFMA